MPRPMMFVASGACLFAALAIAGYALPTWCVFLLVTALAQGLAALGNVVLLRGGLLSFGQSLFYCAGGYGAGLLIVWTGIHDANIAILAGGILAALLAVILGPLLARYRGIAFATLTLALSMLLYGILSKLDFIGGTDGLNFNPPTFFGYMPTTVKGSVYALYLYTSAIIVIIGVLFHLHFGSVRGALSIAMRDNEIRVEYLGISAHRIVAENFVIAGIVGGIGGAIEALAIAHIDPNLAFWTTAGELTFIAVLGGPFSVLAVFVASVLLAAIQSLANQFFPDAWQMALGAFMLVVILCLPHGIGSLLHRRHRAHPAAKVAP